MIVADTNVFSEPLRARPAPQVLAWLADNSSQIVMTSVSAGELLYGAQRLPAGPRRTGLMAGINQAIAASRGDLLVYDENAARIAASMHVAREKTGRPIDPEDLMIAAIAAAHGASVATRNVRDFEGLGVEIVDPWALSR